jgi:hypothetical protein
VVAATENPVRTEPLTRALDRLEDALLDAPLLEAVIARREARVAGDEDRAHTRALAHELCSFQDEDGSWGGDLARTAEALLLVNALALDGDAEVGPTVSAAAAWIRGRMAKPGAFGEGCDPARHEAGLCNHALAGFFSPGPPNADFSGLTLAVPARFGADAEARLGVSSIALDALLRCGVAGGFTDAHLASLRKLVSGEALVPAKSPMVAGLVAALGALIESPPNDRTRSAVERGLARLLGMQRADGSWPGADLFHVLDMLERASAKGFGGKPVDAAIQRAVEMLVLLQRGDGSWGRETGPERMLVGWRALRHAVRSPRQ